MTKECGGKGRFGFSVLCKVKNEGLSVNLLKFVFEMGKKSNLSCG
jgi:hypothetical protein